jgi:hypothetical protein
MSPSLRGGEVKGWHILSPHKVQRSGRVEPASRSRTCVSSGGFTRSESVEKAWAKIKQHRHSIQARSMPALTQDDPRICCSHPGRQCPNRQCPNRHASTWFRHRCRPSRNSKNERNFAAARQRACNSTIHLFSVIYALLTQHRALPSVPPPLRHALP